MGGLTLAATVDIVKQIARALARVHSLGVVHRDVKPDNVFLVEQEDGRPLVKLLDFGVAETVDWTDVIESNQIAGTPEYMSPEILQGTHKADARSDLYALGVLAFECLTGRCPFAGETIEEICDLVTRNDRAYLLDLRPDLPATVDDWMERALHPDPYWRFTSAKEMADDLELALKSAKSTRTPMRRAA
jgi:serine/threonine-protein kinase